MQGRGPSEVSNPGSGHIKGQKASSQVIDHFDPMIKVRCTESDAKIRCMDSDAKTSAPSTSTTTILPSSIAYTKPVHCRLHFWVERIRLHASEKREASSRIRTRSRSNRMSVDLRRAVPGSVCRRSPILRRIKAREHLRLLHDRQDKGGIKNGRHL